jgi:hypothetical protein
MLAVEQAIFIEGNRLITAPRAASSVDQRVDVLFLEAAAGRLRMFGLLR